MKRIVLSLLVAACTVGTTLATTYGCPIQQFVTSGGCTPNAIAAGYPCTPSAVMYPVDPTYQVATFSWVKDPTWPFTVGGEPFTIDDVPCCVYDPNAIVMGFDMEDCATGQPLGYNYGFGACGGFLTTPPPTNTSPI